MNNSALRLFVRSIISEAKDKKADKEPKKPAKKDTKKPEPKKAKKTGGNLVEMKKDLANLKQQLKDIDDLISAFSNVTPENYNTDVEIIGDAIENALKQVEELKKEKESIEKEIASLQESTLSEINKIKEMMGLASSEKKDKKIVDEKKKEEIEEARYNTSANSKEAQSLKKGDIITSGDEVISVSSGAKTPSGKVEVTLKTKDGKTKTSVWGKTTKVGVKK